MARTPWRPALRAAAASAEAWLALLDARLLRRLLPPADGRRKDA